MRFSVFPIVAFILLIVTVASNPVDVSSPTPEVLKSLEESVPPGCVPGWCTSCPLPEDQCTVVTRRHEGYIDVFAFRWNCAGLGTATNIWTINAAYNFNTQLKWVIVLNNLAGDATFWYAGTYYGHPRCGDSFGSWQCVQQFHC